MRKKELMASIGKTVCLSPEIVELVWTAFENEVLDAIERDEPIIITGFGKFYTKTFPSKKYTDFATGELKESKEVKRPVFKFSDNFLLHAREALFN